MCYCSFVDSLLLVIQEFALHLAASYGRAEAAESLISVGADVDAVDEVCLSSWSASYSLASRCCCTCM